MSVKTWKLEFYPVGASSVARDKTKTDVDLFDHCIKKWEGLTEENRKKHGVNYRWHSLSAAGSVSMFMSDSNCALCQRYCPPRVDRDMVCDRCPLAQHRGGVPCWSSTNAVDNVYDTSHYDPEPMINALKAARQWVADGKPAKR